MSPKKENKILGLLRNPSKAIRGVKKPKAADKVEEPTPEVKEEAAEAVPEPTSAEPEAKPAEPEPVSIPEPAYRRSACQCNCRGDCLEGVSR